MPIADTSELLFDTLPLLFGFSNKFGNICTFYTACISGGFWPFALVSFFIISFSLGLFLFCFWAVVWLFLLTVRKFLLVKLKVLKSLWVMLLLKHVHCPLENWYVIAHSHIDVTLLEIDSILAAHEIFVTWGLGYWRNALVVYTDIGIEVAWLIERRVSCLDAIFIELVHGLTPFDL